jgi:sugar lactone lactonase YvrE/enterochelin esterase-like enzyme
MKSIAALIATALLATAALAATDHPLTEDSKPNTAAPKGDRLKGTFEQSTVFPGTTREYTLYIPKQLDRSKPAPFMVLQDGGGYKADTVFDNLIHKKEIPALLGVFVTPGRVKALNSNSLDRYNRSYEYDGLGDHYARFLLDELFPYLERTHGVTFSTSGDDGAIGGASSGAICAFTAAWERPDRFRRVFSSIGTYVGLRGGDVYPTLIRKTEPKPIRIFMQDGSTDLNIYGGDWWMANQTMQRALEFSGYDVKHIWGDGGHNGTHATAIFPDAMRWLWREHPAPIRANPRGESKQPVAKLLAGDWQLVSQGHKFTEGPAVNAAGEVFFTDIPNNRIHKIALDGRVTVFAENTGGANGLMFAPDGKLYAAAGNKILSYDTAGRSSILAELQSPLAEDKPVRLNDLAVTGAGHIYSTEPDARRVWSIRAGRPPQVASTGGILFPNGVRLSPDQSLLYVADMKGQFVWSYQIQPDGALAHRQRYFHLHEPDAAEISGADGMCLDTNGTLFVATSLGVQFCDQAGRVNGIIRKPQPQWLANVVFGGADFTELYACSSDKVFKRKTTTRGANSFQPPVTPVKPRL